MQNQSSTPIPAAIPTAHSAFVRLIFEAMVQTSLTVL
jgi:hypothetical protein